MSEGPLSRLYKQLTDGTITRRQFIERAAYAGVGAGMATFLANANAIAAAGGSRNGFAAYPSQDGTPAAAPTGAGKAPDAGTENQTRGEGGELKMIQWQAATTVNAHQSVGTKDFLISSMVQEPLLHYLEDGTMIPCLAAEVPAVENGLLAEDLSTVTFKLKEGIVWSDGEPLTSRDVQFTFEWITRVENNAVDLTTWSVVEKIDTPDELTAVVTYKTPAANWFEPFAGGVNGPIMPAHLFGDDPAATVDTFLTMPLGTGPYVITEFVPNDRVALVANENYREPNKPFFATIAVKGGGDAPSAARAVLQTGEYHYAWNLQVEPAILLDLAGIEELGEVSADSPGMLVSVSGTSVERIHVNFSDPNKEVDGQRSEVNTPHPFLSDAAVRQALNKAVPRQLIVDEFYGLAARPTPNILTGVETFESQNTSWEFNVDAASQLLEDAGWTMNGDVREKDGVQIVINYGTSINAVRQKTQAVVKQAFESIGIKVNLDQVDAGIFFDSAAGNDRNIGHNYWDITMYTNSPGSPIPVNFFLSWYAGENNINIAQKGNGWSGQNYQRYINPDFDALYEKLLTITDFEEAAQTLIQMNDTLINDVAIIPEVNRTSDTYAIAQTLNNDNLMIGPGFESTLWNIANWRNK